MNLYNKCIDFETKYTTIKEEIEKFKNSIIEKETCLMIDKSLIKYCSEKNKCKFCKHEVSQEDLMKISKS